MATVTLVDVNKVFDNGVHVIHDLSLDIAESEFLVLVGPSGSGKSTALRMVAGLESITSGEIRIGDKVVNDVQPKDRDIAMVFQNMRDPHMTVQHRSPSVARPEDEIDTCARRLVLAPTQPGIGSAQPMRAIAYRGVPMDEPLSNSTNCVSAASTIGLRLATNLVRPARRTATCSSRHAEPRLHTSARKPQLERRERQKP